MSNAPFGRQEDAHRELHPFVFRVMLAVAIGWVAIAWLLFSGHGYASITLGMITVFTVVSIGIPFVIRNIWTHHPEAHAAGDACDSFRRWLKGDFDTWQSRISARDAIAGILIPFGAVMLAAILIGIVFDLSGP